MYHAPSPCGRALAILIAVLGAGSTFASPARAATAPATAYVAVVEEGDGDLAVNRFAASSPQQVEDHVDELRATGAVVSVEVDRPVRALGEVDPLRVKQWALNQIPFERSWPLTDGTGAIVAVLDTGVDASHEDLTGTVLEGWDTIANAPGATTDPDGHGTHVSGIIAAAAGNGKGVAGAAPGVRILPVRVLDDTGSGRLADILEGIIWAADHGADVINLSLGGPGTSTTYAKTLRYATDKGAVVVAAAGNEALEGNAPSYPAADPATIAVAATTASGTRASFSNYGAYVDLAAPGASIQSTIPSGYASWSGTSMAAPYAAAAAALIAARHPAFTPADIRDLLERSARDLGPAGRDDQFGAGLIDPAAALAVPEPAPLPPAPTPTPAAPVAPPPALDPEPVDGDVPHSRPETEGYWVVSADGHVDAFGAAPFLGDVAGTRLAAPVVAAAATPSGHGYWVIGADGAVYPFGDAAFHGSALSLKLTAPIVGAAVTASGNGYWLLGRDGGVFSFGDAAFFGSTGGMTLNQPVVDMTPTPTGRGYWLVASDGGVFAFGDAAFHGSTGAVRLNRPVVSLATSTEGGYWMVATDGGIFAFDAAFHGSLPGLAPTGLPDGKRIRGTEGGAGYYILGTNGRVFPFGDARHFGSTSPGRPAVDLVLVP
jgi:type VII secretion-associated serine protease mycosin